MNKTIISTLFTLILLLSLTACTSDSTTSAGNETILPSPDSFTPPASQPEASNATQPANLISFEETVIVDNDNCSFKITAIDDDGILGYTLKAYLENKTDKDLMFSLDDVSINGVLCDPFWASSVSAGMKANEEITFLRTTLKESGITTVTVIEFTLNVYDSNDYTADYLVSETFTIHPMGEEAVRLFTHTPTPGEITLFDNEYATMIITGENTDSIWGYTLTVYLENKTDKNVIFSADDVSVNGFMCDPFWAVEIPAGKCSNTTISWLSDDFEKNGITEAESITLPVTVYDSNAFPADPMVEDTFTFSPDFK